MLYGNSMHFCFFGVNLCHCKWQCIPMFQYFEHVWLTASGIFHRLPVLGAFLQVLQRLHVVCMIVTLVGEQVLLLSRHYFFEGACFMPCSHRTSARAIPLRYSDTVEIKHFLQTTNPCIPQVITTFYIAFSSNIEFWHVLAPQDPPPKGRSWVPFRPCLRPTSSCPWPWTSGGPRRGPLPPQRA